MPCADAPTPLALNLAPPPPPPPPPVVAPVDDRPPAAATGNGAPPPGVCRASPCGAADGSPRASGSMPPVAGEGSSNLPGWRGDIAPSGVCALYRSASGDVLRTCASTKRAGGESGRGEGGGRQVGESDRRKLTPVPTPPPTGLPVRAMLRCSIERSRMPMPPRLGEGVLPPRQKLTETMLLHASAVSGRCALALRVDPRLPGGTAAASANEEKGASLRRPRAKSSVCVRLCEIRPA